jgi:hypothetical protein
MVVPIFAPIINGAACLSLTIFCATIGTTTEVVMVLDRMQPGKQAPEKGFQLTLKKEPAKNLWRFCF